MVNEDNVNGIMGAIAVTKNSGAIGSGDLLCTLFHRKEDLANIGKAEEENAPRTTELTMSPPAGSTSVPLSTTGPVSPPWSSNIQNTGTDSTTPSSDVASSAAFGLGSIPKDSGVDTSYRDSKGASSVPDWSKAKASPPSERSFLPPPLSAFEQDASFGRSTPPFRGLGSSEMPRSEESETPATTGMSYLDSMNANAAAIDWSKAGKVSPSSENDSAVSLPPSTNQAGSPAEHSAFGLGSVPKMSQKAQPKTSSAAGMGHLDDLSANTSAQDWSEAKSSSPAATNEQSDGDASAAFGLGSVQKRSPRGEKSNTSTMAGTSYLDSMASATSASNWSMAKSPSSSESTPASPTPPANPRGTTGPSRSSSADSARTDSVSTGDNHHSQLEDGPAKPTPELTSAGGAGMTYLDSMSTNAAAPDWSNAKAPNYPDTSPVSPPAAAPSSPDRS